MPKGTIISAIQRNLAFYMLIDKEETPENIWELYFDLDMTK